MSSGRIAQHRNYGELMARHEKEIRVKKIIRIFMYFLIIAFMVLVFLLVKRVQQKSKHPTKPATSWIKTTGTSACESDNNQR